MTFDVRDFANLAQFQALHAHRIGKDQFSSVAGERRTARAQRQQWLIGQGVADWLEIHDLALPDQCIGDLIVKGLLARRQKNHCVGI